MSSNDEVKCICEFCWKCNGHYKVICACKCKKCYKQITKCCDGDCDFEQHSIKNTSRSYIGNPFYDSRKN